MAKELNCPNCGKFLGTITDGKVSKGLQPVCTVCFNLMRDAAGNCAKHVLDTKKKDKPFSSMFDDWQSNDKFDDLFGKK